jgi:uncharacterized protein YjbI with pentapeptide repeats
MARVFCPAPINVMSRITPAARRPYAFNVDVVALARWDGGALERDLTTWPEAAFRDEGLQKHRAEWLAFGSAFAPGGKPRTAMGIGVAIGPQKKRLAVFGHRMWKGSTHSAPAPFTEIPVDWHHAFGGEGYADNPLGKGFAPGLDGVHLLPNVEDPRRLASAPSDRLSPAGFGAVAADAPARAAKLGTYDKAWLERDWPGYARDRDETYFNVAPPDQWLPESQWWKGDESVVAEGMHPGSDLLEGRLPGLRARCFINQRLGDAAPVFREVPTRLETLVLFPDLERIALVFRGVVESAEDDGDDILHVLAALEAIDNPKPFEHYRESFARRLDRKRVAARAEDDGDLLPASIDTSARLPGPDASDLDELVKTERLLTKNFRRRAELELARTRERLVAEGIDPDKHGVPKELPPAIEDLDEEQAEQARVDARKELDGLRAEVEAKLAGENERLRKVCEENGVDFDAKVAENKKSEGGPPKSRASDVLARLEDAATLCRNGGVADADNPLLEKLNNEELRASLARMDALALEAYRRYAHVFPAAAALEGDEGRRARQSAIEALAAPARSLARRDLTGVDLSGLDLAGCDLTEALLEKADLRDANLERTNFSRAVLARADLGGARTRGAVLAGANLGEARLDGLDLTEVDLRGAVLVKANFRGTNLSGAKLEGCDLEGANFAEANLEGAKARGVAFTGTRLLATRFAGADLAGAMFDGLDLGDLDFTGACLDGADLHDCSGDKATFTDASLLNARFTHGEQRSSYREADFSSAHLEHANLRELDLRGAKFTSASLGDADLSKSNCTGADFRLVVAPRSLWMRTDLTDADLRSANLREAMMQNAQLAGAKLDGANLFAANLIHVRVDGSTDISGAELGQALYREERR